jgi:hypothetical protein
MLQYAVLIYEDEAKAAEAHPEELEAVLHSHGEFVARYRSNVLDSQRLRPSRTSTSIRRAAGNVVMTDGAFVEAKEMLAGIYLIQASDLDEALRIAEDVPAPWGGVELRPLWPES